MNNKYNDICWILDRHYKYMTEAPTKAEYQSEKAYYNGVLDTLLFMLPSGYSLDRENGKHTVIKAGRATA